MHIVVIVGFNLPILENSPYLRGTGNGYYFHIIFDLMQHVVIKNVHMGTLQTTTFEHRLGQLGLLPESADDLSVGFVTKRYRPTKTRSLV